MSPRFCLSSCSLLLLQELILVATLLVLSGFFNLIKEVSQFLFSYIAHSLLFTSLRYLSSNLLITSLGCSFSFISSLYSFCFTYTRGMAGGWKYLLINVKKSNYEAAKPYPRLLFYLLTAAQATSLLRQPGSCYHLWHHPPAHLCQV